MYKCNLCNKKFNYESEFNRHKDKKNPCSQKKEKLECLLCKVKFIRPSEKIRHNETKKHIYNINFQNNNTDELINENNELINLKEINIDKLTNENIELKNENKELKAKNIELTEIIKNLENEFNLLKQLSNNQLITNEYIYIVHERTFVLTNVNIYKIGKTKNIKNRMNNYTKGSILLFTIPCIDSNKLEKIILNYLKQNDKYIQVKDYGNEYFACDINHLINDIHILVNQNN
jgi:predicted RNase H-like nuclease (RuvC/YqgF family)